MVEVAHERAHQPRIFHFLSSLARAPFEKTAEAIPGVLKENIILDAEMLYIEAAPRKKEAARAVYCSFVKFLGLTWKAPKCKYNRVIPFIPLESELDDLVRGCACSLSALLQTQRNRHENSARAR